MDLKYRQICRLSHFLVWIIRAMKVSRLNYKHCHTSRFKNYFRYERGSKCIGFFWIIRFFQGIENTFDTIEAFQWTRLELSRIYCSRYHVRSKISLVGVTSTHSLYRSSGVCVAVVLATSEWSSFLSQLHYWSPPLSTTTMSNCKSSLMIRVDLFDGIIAVLMSQVSFIKFRNWFIQCYQM